MGNPKFNRAGMSTATTGTGTITLGSALDGFQTFAAAGVSDSDVVSYFIEDGTSWEVGEGTYTATGTTLSRTVTESSNADAAISLSGDAKVYIGLQASDVGVGSLGVQVFTSSGTYTPTAGTKFVKVTCTAGGQGGGEESGGVPGFGGTAGQTSIRFLTDADIGSSQTVTIGAGGSAGLGTGGETSFGTLVVAKPGVNSGNVGDISFGGEKNPPPGTPDTTGTGLYAGGTGGASYWGGYHNSTPTNPFGTGGEGGGLNNGTSYGAVAGNPGVCVVEEFG